MADNNLTLHPRWRQAVLDFLAEFKYGDLIPHAWLEAHFDLPEVDGMRLTAAQFRERQFEWLGSIEAFKAELLRNHKVMLQSVRGKGYRWTRPHEQTAIAVREFEDDVRRAFKTTGQRLRNVRVHELTDDQRRENVDAVAKISALRGTVRKQLPR